jgi:mannose-6-phosphate isomerase-like protein (cupin superfamily)
MTGALRPATHARHYEQAPAIVDAVGTRSWITRAGNFVVVVSDAKAGAVLERRDNPDESMVLLPAGVAALVEAEDDSVRSDGDSLTVVPPGPSRVTLHSPGIVVRIFSTQAADVVAQASNSSVYDDGAPELAPIVPWPQPAGGFRLRHYALSDYASPDPSPLKMRVFRSTNLMINLFLPWTGARDETKLSPHSHDDFEQVSLALEGSFVHHLRYAWTADRSAWRDDEHVTFHSPSVLVIPARVIHTSQNIGDGLARLVDIFAPPRLDFSQKPGFVLNARDYPMPEANQAGG